MSASIRLKRMGTKKRPFYRIVVMDGRLARDGRTIDEIGVYHPIAQADKQILFDADKAKGWLEKGAEVSVTVHRIFNKKGLYL